MRELNETADVDEFNNPITDTTMNAFKYKNYTGGAQKRSSPIVYRITQKENEMFNLLWGYTLFPRDTESQYLHDQCVRAWIHLMEKKLKAPGREKGRPIEELHEALRQGKLSLFLEENIDTEEICV